MSYIGYGKRGGMQGILFSYEEALELSNLIGSKYLDEYVPLPNISLEKQVTERIKVCNSNKDDCGDNVEYYERDNGSHGWCCTYCGKVHQWG